MLDHLHLENLICLDIETVPSYEDFLQMPEPLQELYLKKSERLKQEGETPDEQYFNHAGIYAEFGKVICVSLGIFKKEKDHFQLRLKSIYGDDEKKLLESFCDLLNQHYNKPDRYQFCGHNIREFDIPYLSRRLLIHHLDLPAALDISGRKPWEVNMIDTLQLCNCVAIFRYFGKVGCWFGLSFWNWLNMMEVWMLRMMYLMMSLKGFYLASRRV
jgi:DNA polymerase elongation subunit (family B)